MSDELNKTSDELKAQAVQMAINAHAEGELDLGWHKACKHPDTIKAKAECYVRREVVKQKQEKRPSEVTGRYGRWHHVSKVGSGKGVTYGDYSPR